MTYRGDSMGGFIGHHLSVAALEALRPAADNAGRIATVGTPGQTAAYYVSAGNGWVPVATLATDPLTGKAVGLTTPAGTVPFGGIQVEAYGMVAGSTAYRNVNRLAFQAALDAVAAAGGGRVELTTPGVYHIGGYYPSTLADFPALLSVTSDTEVYIGPGVELQAPQDVVGDINKNCAIFANKNIQSNSVALTVANTTTVAGSQTQRYTTVTFETATAHGFSAGNYVLLKGDTSDYEWDGVYKAYAIPDSTHFTVRIFYRQAAERTIASILPTGPVVAYRADNNIKITVDGILNMNQNVNNAPVGNGRATITLNKIGFAEVSANYDGCIVGLAASNFDRLLVPRVNFNNGSIPTWLSGPFRDFEAGQIYSRGTEEVIYGYNKETGLYLFSDADGTGNTGGNIRSIRAERIISTQNSIRALCFNAGNSQYIGAIWIGELHAYAHGQVIELASIAAQSGTIKNMVVDSIIHDPDPSSDCIRLNPNSTGNLTIEYLEVGGLKNPERPYKNAKFLTCLNATTGVCKIKKVVFKGINSIHDLTNSSATQTSIDFGPGVGWTIEQAEVHDSVFTGTGSTRTLYGVGTGSTIGTFGEINVTNSQHDAALGSLLSAGKTGGRYRLSDCRNKQNTGTGLVFTNDSCTIEMDRCTSATGTSLINAIGSNKTWTFKTSLCESGDYAFKGFAGATGNLINVVSGGGGSGSAAKLVPDKRAGTVFKFHHDCSDYSYDIDTTYVTRNDGAIVHNSNAALGTLAVAALVICQGTAASSWHRMDSPTLVY
jgi:hypothetical protein